MTNFNHPNPRTQQKFKRILQASLVLTSLAGVVYLTRHHALSLITNSTVDSQPAIATTNLAQPTLPPMIGINLSGIADWSTQWCFVDVFKTSRDWVSQQEGAEWGKGGPIKLTADGWVASLAPGQTVETVMMINTNRYPSGQYTLLYEGEGKLGFGLDNAKIVSQTPGRMVVDVKPSNDGVFLQIRETNPNNPIRNIRFIMPGFEQTYQTQPFHPLFLERIARFRALRFMDWMSTNNSPIVNWAERSTLTSPRYAGDRGVPLEVMIQLANTLKIDPWFTIPVKASDDYVRQFATLVRDRLDPSLKAHIEYSNELWNTMFTQQQYVGQQGLARKLDTNDYTASIRYASERSVEIFKIVEQVFGASTSKRVVRVLAGQAANTWTGEEMLGWKDAYKHTDAYAIAPYFYGANLDSNGDSDLNDATRVDAILRMSEDQIIDNLLQGMETKIKPLLETNRKVTKQYGVALYAYEGGPHLTAYQFPADKSDRLTDLYARVNRHPRMREVYRAYLAQWKQSGGALFNQFVDVAQPSKWGFWGAMEYQNQDLNQAPKYQGLIDFINANPPSR